MKARWTMKCECCKRDILVGSQYVVMFGRPWITAHAIEYKRQRKARVTF